MSKLKEFHSIFGFPAPMCIIGLDVIALDAELTRRDPQYDGQNCTYKGKNISMCGYVELKYGLEAAELIRSLI